MFSAAGITVFFILIMICLNVSDLILYKRSDGVCKPVKTPYSDEIAAVDGSGRRQVFIVTGEDADDGYTVSSCTANLRCGVVQAGRLHDGALGRLADGRLRRLFLHAAREGSPTAGEPREQRARRGCSRSTRTRRSFRYRGRRHTLGRYARSYIPSLSRKTSLCMESSICRARKR